MKILSIGNSFSEDAQRYLHAMASHEGFDLLCANLYIGGCTLERHYNNLVGEENQNGEKPYVYFENSKRIGESTLTEGIGAHDWDIITLQQASRASFNKESYFPYLDELAAYLRKRCPKAKIYIHQTWSYSSASRLVQLGFDRHADMFSFVERSYAYAAERIGADGTILAGQTLERLQNKGIVPHRDGFHASLGVGRFAVALTWLGTLFDFDVTKVSFNDFDEPISDTEYKTAVECAKETLEAKGFLYPSRTKHTVPYSISWRGEPDRNPERALDMYLPDSEGFDTFVYFHGGGFVTGDKDGLFAEVISRYFTENGIAFVSANYRMYPNASYPDYVKDSALAVSFIKKNIASYGGSGRIFVGGTSAGGYLSQMLCFDRKWLGFYDIEPSDIAGFVHDAGQPTTHFNVLKERGFNPWKVVVDEAAPLYYVGDAKEYPPMYFILADDDMKNRPEQTELMLSTMSHLGYDMSKVKKTVVANAKHSSYCCRVDDDGKSFFAKLIVEFIKSV